MDAHIITVHANNHNQGCVCVACTHSNRCVQHAPPTPINNHVLVRDKLNVDTPHRYLHVCGALIVASMCACNT